MVEWRGVGEGGRVWLRGTALASRRGGQREKMMAFVSLSVEKSWRGKRRQPQPHIPLSSHPGAASRHVQHSGKQKPSRTVGQVHLVYIDMHLYLMSNLVSLLPID